MNEAGARTEASTRPLVRGDGTLQASGRAVLSSFHSAAQALKLYPAENTAVQNAIADLHRSVERVVENEGVMELRVAGEFIFLNDARLRFELSSYATITFVARALDNHGIGTLEAESVPARGEWTAFLSLLVEDPAPEEPFEEFVRGLRGRSVRSISVYSTTDAARPEDEESKEVAKRTYFECVQTAQDVFTQVRLGKAVKVRRMKRAVQSMVDQVIREPNAILGMTTLREYDEYTFTHSVNVCILSLLVGQKVGLSKHQLYELGVGALFHDLGKMKIDAEVTTKPGGLTKREWAEMQQHPTEGLLALFAMQGFSELPFRAMLMAYEHHMKIDLSGYPTCRRDRDPGLYSRIVAVCDGFDAATSKRSYQSVPLNPDEVLREMRENPKRGYDPLLVKLLINTMGIYPVGTVAILDTRELAVVIAPNRDAGHLHQPIVKIIFEPSGMALPEPVVTDLSELDPATGQPKRAIVKTTEPERYGIRVSDYFV